MSIVHASEQSQHTVSTRVQNMFPDITSEVCMKKLCIGPRSASERETYCLINGTFNPKCRKHTYNAAEILIYLFLPCTSWVGAVHKTNHHTGNYHSWLVAPVSLQAFKCFSCDWMYLRFFYYTYITWSCNSVKIEHLKSITVVFWNIHRTKSSEAAAVLREVSAAIGKRFGMRAGNVSSFEVQTESD